MAAYKHKSSIRADWSKNGRRVVLSCKKDNNKIREPHSLYERTVLVVVFGLQESLLHLPTSNPISIANRSILFVLYFNRLYGRCQVFQKPFYAKASFAGPANSGPMDYFKPGKPVCRKASYKIIAAELERLSERAAALSSIGILIRVFE